MYTSTISDQTDWGTLAHYDGASPLAGIPLRNDIVAEYDNGMTAILQQSLSGKQPIHFMPTDVSDEAKSSYILRISGTLINGQKVIIDITGIKPFFDVEVPDNYSPSSFKTILACILSIRYSQKHIKVWVWGYSRFFTSRISYRKESIYPCEYLELF